MPARRPLGVLLAASCAVVAVGCGAGRKHADPTAPLIPPTTIQRLTAPPGDQLPALMVDPSRRAPPRSARGGASWGALQGRASWGPGPHGAPAADRSGGGGTPEGGPAKAFGGWLGQAPRRSASRPPRRGGPRRPGSHVRRRAAA